MSGGHHHHTAAAENMGVEPDCGCWYSSSWSLDLDLVTANLPGGVLLPGLERDGPPAAPRYPRRGRGALLDSRTVSSFQRRVYLVWDISGHVTIQSRRWRARTRGQRIFFQAVPGGASRHGRAGLVLLEGLAIGATKPWHGDGRRRMGAGTPKGARPRGLGGLTACTLPRRCVDGGFVRRRGSRAGE